jgi:hypothetical protein
MAKFLRVSETHGLNVEQLEEWIFKETSVDEGASSHTITVTFVGGRTVDFTGTEATALHRYFSTVGIEARSATA